MATGAITAVEILATGWEADIEVEGFTTGMTIDFGSGRGSPADLGAIDDATIIFNVRSPGYNSSGTLVDVDRQVYATKIVRKPYPDNADNQESLTAGGAKIRVALNEYIYSGDDAGGNAPNAIDITCTISGGAIRNDGGASQLSTESIAGACTNSSTAAYPLPVFEWDRTAGVCTGDRVIDDFYLAARAYQRFGNTKNPVACIRFDVDGVTSTVNDNLTVSTTIPIYRPKTGLYVPCFRASFDLSQFTQAELINCRARAYPHIGDSTVVLDTNNYTTATEEPLNRNKAVIVCDKDAALNVYAIVDAATGNDGTGVASATLATAEASPYLSVGKARQGGANVIYMLAGTQNAVGTVPSSRVAGDEWVRVMPYPGLDASDVTVTVPTALTSYKMERLQYIGLTIQKTSNSASWYGDNTTGNRLRFSNCTFDHNASARPSSAGVSYGSYATYFDNCDGDLGDDSWYFASSAAQRVGVLFDGVDFGAPTSTTNSIISTWYEVVGCKGVGAIQFTMKGATAVSPLQGNLDFSYNAFYDFDSTGAPLVNYAAFEAIVATGFACVGNICEKTAATSALLQLAASGTDYATHHVMLWNNTTPGERVNMAYNSVGTAAVYHTQWSLKNNSFKEINMKSDLFGTPSGNRIGNWALLNGVGCANNNVQEENFPQEYGGNGYSVDADPGYTDDLSGSGGAGQGDYSPAADSSLLNRIPTNEATVAYDLFGANIADNGAGTIGAVQFSTVVDVDRATIGDPITANNVEGRIASGGSQLAKHSIPAGGIVGSPTFFAPEDLPGLSTYTRLLPGQGVSTDLVDAVSPIARKLGTDTADATYFVVGQGNSRYVGTNDGSNSDGSMPGGWSAARLATLCGQCAAAATTSETNPTVIFGTYPLGVVSNGLATNNENNPTASSALYPDFSRFGTGSSRNGSTGPGAGLVLEAGDTYTRMAYAADDGSTGLFTPDRSITFRTAYLAFPGAGTLRWNTARGSASNTVSVSGSTSDIDCDTVSSIHYYDTANDSYTSGTKTLVLESIDTFVLSEVVAGECVYIPARKSLAQITSIVSDLHPITPTYTIVLRHVFGTAPQNGDELHFGPGTITTVSTTIDTTGDYAYRGLTHAAVGGPVFILWHDAWVSENGWVFGGVGWGGNGNDTQLSAAMDGNWAQIFAALDPDLVVHGMATQNDGVDYHDEMHDEIVAGAPSAEVVEFGEVVHGQNGTSLDNNISEVSYHNVILAEAASESVPGVSLYEAPEAGEFGEHVVNGWRENAQHLSARGSLKTALLFFAKLAGLSGGGGGVVVFLRNRIDPTDRRDSMLGRPQ